jgi:hypothetical protein
MVQEAHGLSSLHDNTDGWPTSTAQVNLVTIDSEVGDREIAIIKVDVEGHELPALRGAQTTITRCRPVLVIEHTRWRFAPSHQPYQGPPDLEDNRALYCQLRDLGYRWFDLDGNGPLAAEAFRSLYLSGERFNFLAVPE